MKNNNVTDKELVQIKYLRDLKEVGYRSKSIKAELRDNLIEKLKNKEQVFQGIWGYEETV
ncbi:MAG: magnesium chelatase, partial [Bacteroidetes bacterium]|nr:magnesium chelatase [Bacteroidota bacterium]